MSLLIAGSTRLKYRTSWSLKFCAEFSGPQKMNLEYSDVLILRLFTTSRSKCTLVQWHVNIQMDLDRNCLDRVLGKINFSAVSLKQKMLTLIISPASTILFVLISKWDGEQSKHQPFFDFQHWHPVVNVFLIALIHKYSRLPVWFIKDGKWWKFYL